jgi:lipopolysaccharide export LptBFGC system permease protein LptF
MNVLRILAGWACIVAALALIVLFALGGASGVSAPASPALMAHLPPVAVGLALLAAGVWLLKKGKTRR